MGGQDEVTRNGAEIVHNVTRDGVEILQGEPWIVEIILRSPNNCQVTMIVMT